MVIVLLIGVALLVSALFSARKEINLVGAAVAFAIYFAIPQFAYLVFLLFLLGVTLLVLELYVPDLGIMGIIGLVTTSIALFLKTGDIVEVLLIIVYTFFVSGAIILFNTRQGKVLNIGSGFVLENTLNKEQGYSANADLSSLVSTVGQAVTDLRPVGRAEFDGKTYDVISMSDMITRGSVVRIEKVEGSTLYVRRGD